MPTLMPPSTLLLLPLLLLLLGACARADILADRNADINADIAAAEESAARTPDINTSTTPASGKPTCDKPPARKEGIATYTCSAGDPQHKEQTIAYTVATPAACASEGGGCGVVMDVHGFTMTGAQQEQADDFQALGNGVGYIVVQPTAPLDPQGKHDWRPLVHHDALLLFLREVVAAFGADRARVHVMGYSQGGFAAWSLLCKAPDLVCSAAPLEASALDAWGAGYGTGGCFTPPARGPAVARSILFTNGVTDVLSVVANARRQVADVAHAWGLNPAAARNSSGFKYTASSWSTPRLNFSYLEHDYNITNQYASSIKGHCFPTTKEDGCAMSDAHGVFRCCGAFTWARRALAFFQDNPCR
jgi:poly(3-hydroxybutyrate) depolymerase